VRLASAVAASLGADLHGEARVLALVAAAGLGPRPVHCEPSRSLLVTEWIDAVDRAGPPCAADLASAGACLARLHALPVPQGLRAVDFRRQAGELRTAAGPMADADPLAALAERVFDAATTRAPRECLCHNDLNPSNVLVDAGGRFWLVDWEYAGRGNPAYDLASYASQHGLDDEQRTALLEAYRKYGGQADAQGLRLAVWGFDYVQALWYRALAAAPQGAPLDRATALERAAGLENSLHRRASDAGGSDNTAFVS
jgi:thiamine kinase